MRSIVTALAAVVGLAPSYPAAATDCPGAAIKDTFVVERGGDSKTEVFRGDDGSVRQVMRYRGRALLETTMHEGLFELERLDRGTRYVLTPKADLKKFFPLRAKQKIEVSFDVKQAANAGRSLVKLAVIGADKLEIGPCKYEVQRNETGARLFDNVDYYALKFVIAKEYKERDGRTTLIKYDKIYLSQSGGVR